MEENKMKLFDIRILGLARRRALAASLSLVMLAVISPMASADSATWSLDSDASSVRFFQGSKAVPDSVNTGVARVTGTVNLNTDNLNSSLVDLNIFPAGEDWGSALSAQGDLPAGFVPDVTEHTLLTFRSKRIVRTGDGKLQVIGDLTLTRVERSVTATPSEAYAGPIYGDPVIHTETREISFLFPGSGAEPLSGGLQSAAQTTQPALDLSGSAVVVHEDLPELLSAIQDTNWPTVVENERCVMPSTIGEDYQGATCTGTVIAATDRDNCEIPASGAGEGYSGAVCAPPAGDQTTVVLDLKLRQAVSEPSAETFSAVGGSR
jgi:polyisoprenoid-binding protein YceI